MMKSLKSRSRSRADDQVVKSLPRSGSWRCRSCTGDYVSPSPKAHQKGRESNKSQKNDFQKDPLFMKPSQPIPAREDNSLAVKWRQEGHAKENESNDVDSQRGKIDLQLPPKSQQDQGELKPPGGKGDEKGPFEQSPRFSLHLNLGHTKGESFDLFELTPNPTALDEVAGDGVKGPGDGVKGLVEADPLSNHGHLGSDALGATKESSATGKTGLNINIPQERSILQEGEGEGQKEKVLEETESPVSVLQGIPELETPQKESGEVLQAWKENKSTQMEERPAEEELQCNGPLRPDSSTSDTDPTSNHTLSCAGSQPVAEKLECPFDNVQTDSSESSELAKSGNVSGTPQAESLQQGVPETEGECPDNNVADEKVEGSGEAGPQHPLIGEKDHSSPPMESLPQRGSADHERETLNGDSLEVLEGGEKTKDGLDEKQILDGGLLEGGEKTKDGLDEKQVLDGGLVESGEKTKEGLDEKEILDAGLLEGLDKSFPGSSVLYTDRPDKTDLQHSANPVEAAVRLQHQESNSFKLGVFTVPHVIVVGAITVISLLGKANSH